MASDPACTFLHTYMHQPRCVCAEEHVHLSRCVCAHQHVHTQRSKTGHSALVTVLRTIVFREENLNFIGMELKVFVQKKKKKTRKMLITFFRYAKKSHMIKGVRLGREDLQRGNCIQVLDLPHH